MTLYMVKMGIEHVTLNACGSNGTEHRWLTVVEADNEEGARDLARDQLRALLVDSADIVVYDAIWCEREWEA